MDEDDSRRLAQRLLEDLDELLDPTRAGALRDQITDLIDRGERGEAVTVPIIQLIRDHPDLARAAATYDLIDDPARTILLPPGNPRLPLPPRYVCPVDGYEYFRHDLARPVPPCPNDGTELLLDAGTTR